MKEDIEKNTESSPQNNLFPDGENINQNILKYYFPNGPKEVQTLENSIKSEAQNSEANKFKYKSKKHGFDEKSALLNEKEGLKLILKVINDDLDLDEETLEEVYEPLINNEDMTKRVIKENTGRCSVMFMFYIISPLFGIINLISIYESLLMMRILLQVLTNTLLSVYESWTDNPDEISKFSVYDFTVKYNYYYMFFDDARKESFDFNLMIFTAFLGDILLQSRGFRVSTFIFAIINIGAIFLIISFSFLDYNTNDNTFSLLKILYLILGYILLLIGVGASALLSQQIIIDSNYKYNDYIKKLNNKSLELIEEERKKKEAEREKQENIQVPILEDMIQYYGEEEKIEESKDEKEEEKINEEIGEEKEVKVKEGIEGEEKGEEKKEGEEKIISFKTSKSGSMKPSIISSILENIKKEEEEKEEIEKGIKFKKLETNINQVDRRKVALSRSKTTLITRRDKIFNKHSTIFKEKELRKKEKEKAKANIKKKSRFDSFFMVCITTIIGYFMKYIINLIIVEKRNLKIDNYITLTNCGNNTDCFKNLILDKNLSSSNKNLFNDLIGKIYGDSQNSFYIIIIVYGGCIVLSILLYSFFVCIFDKRKKNQDEEIQKNKYRVCEICGYIIYSQNIIFNPQPPKCECLKLLCETFLNCINMAISSIGECKCCNKCDDDKDKDNNENIIEDNIDDKIDDNNKYSDYINMVKTNNYKKDNKDNKISGNSCLEYKEADFVKNKQFFCYCYQAQRKYYWLNQFLTNDIQKKLFPFMVEYFILQLLICAFEKQYFQQFDYNTDTNFNPNSTNFTNSNNLINFNYLRNSTDNSSASNDSNNVLINDLYSFLTFILTFFLFFYFTLSFARIVSFFTYREDQKEKEGFENLKKLSFGILDGTHGVLIFDGFFALIFSSLYLSDNNNPLFDNTNLLLIPILMNKFYYFTLIFYCISYSEEKRKFELISSSTLISIYIFILNFIISLIRNNISIKSLHIIQLVFSCLFPCLMILGLIAYFVLYIVCPPYDYCAGRLTLLCCYASYICCCGGFWLTNDFYERLELSISEDSLDFSEDCFCDCCYCLFDCFRYMTLLPFCKSICPRVMCGCCNCCICYDCCECCDCFYCCGNECACEYC